MTTPLEEEIIDEEGSSTTSRSENLKLSITSDGPVSGGAFTANNNQKLFMEGFVPGGPVTVSSDGVKHFTNWDASLTSIDNNTTRFESKGTGKVLDYEYSAEKIKILDDVAAVAYPDYTHINKTVWEHELGGIYQPWIFSTFTAYDTVVTDHYRFDQRFFLPLINHHALKQYEIEGKYDNLFIIIEYDGKYTDTSGDIATRSTAVEVFKYVESDVNEAGTFFFDEEYGQMMMRSRFSVDGPILDNGDSRVTENQVVSDLSRLSTDDYLTTISDTPAVILSKVNFSDEDVKWGFMGYSKISIVKYQPIVKCGRVDLFKRQSDTITSITSNSIVTSVGHGLKNGDMIKITGRFSEENLHGIKHIQINGDDSFTIYEDASFNDKTEINDTGIDNSVRWTLIGATGSNRQGWNYIKSITSPTGKNGMGETWNNFDEINPSIFNNAESFGEIFSVDAGFNFAAPATSPTYTDMFNSRMAVRNNSSNHDALWAGEDHFINGYRFGSDIDLIKDGNDWNLLVGEEGLDTVFMYSDTSQYINLPTNAPHGRAHLISINSSYATSLIKTISASTDSSVGAAPDISSGTLLNNFFYTKRVGREDSAASQASNTLPQDLMRSSFRNSFGHINDPYWFGAMLYHVPTSFEGTPDNNYYSNLYLDQLNTFATDSTIFTAPFEYVYPNAVGKNSYYAYVDSFGKSVAVKVVDGKKLCFVGSTVKPTIEAKNDCGYVHVYNITDTNMDQKIAGSGGFSPAVKTYQNYMYKCRSFAKTIVYNKGLYFGEPKASLFYQGSTSGNVSVAGEVSKIYRYTKDSAFSLTQTIENPNNFLSSYNGNASQINYKEDSIRGTIPVDSASTGVISHKDRFGEFFTVDDDILVTNAFDIANDLGELHTDTTLTRDLPLDYLNVFEYRSGNWVYAGKLSASIDSSLSKYSYNSTLYPKANLNLRVVNNINYDNDRTGSVTWDIDLHNSYGIADDRIILKDPLGYAIFRRNWNLNANPDLVTAPGQTTGGTTTPSVCGDIRVPVFPYFSFNENFLAYDDCNILHTKFSELYKYTESRDVKFTTDLANNSIEHKAPVYFMSIPNVSPLNEIEITASTFNPSPQLKMVILRRDPRLTIVPESDYVELDEEYSQIGEIPGDLFISAKPDNPKNIYRSGVLDAAEYHDFTPASESSWGKKISGVVSNGAIKYTISFEDINLYKLPSSRVQDSVRVFNRKDGEYVDHLEIDMTDIQQSTYDEDMTVDNTLIIAFVYDYSTTPYQVPYEGSSINASTVINSVQGKTNPIQVVVDNGNDGGASTEESTRQVLNVYDCIFDAVTTYTNFVAAEGDGRLVYTNPTLGIGTSQAPSTFDIGSASCMGTFSQSYQILSIDNSSTYSVSRSLDIQELESLSLLLFGGGGGVTGGGGDPDPTGNGDGVGVNLFMPSPANTVVDSLNMRITSEGSSGILNLHLANTGANGSLNLYQEGVGPGSGNVNLFLASNYGSGSLPLRISSPAPASGFQELYIAGPIPFSGSMPLVIKGDDPINAVTNATIFMEGLNTLTGTDTNDSSYIHISGPGTIGDPASHSGMMPLHIGNFQNVTANTNDLGIYLQNNQTQEVNFIGNSRSASLFINSNYSSDNSAFLHIHRNGQFGGEELYGTQSMHVHNIQNNNSLNMVVSSANFISNSLNASISGTGHTYNNISTFVRGYEE